MLALREKGKLNPIFEYTDHKKNLSKEEDMKKGLFVLVFALLILLPVSTLAANGFGGLTFIGDRQGVCVEIDGSCVSETISFDLDTCDANQVEKEQYREKMPFTLLVPVGTHKMIIKKDGKKIVTDEIRISAEEVLEYKLP